mgnify:CR=1 FL=1
MTGLTTHVLDTALGKPAQGLRIQLMRMNGVEAEFIKTVFTNDDGRVDGGPMLIGDTFQVGQYELLFHAGDYLKAKGFALTEPGAGSDVAQTATTAVRGQGGGAQKAVSVRAWLGQVAGCQPLGRPARGVMPYRGSSDRPACSASRAALLTGCYPNRVGVSGAYFPGSKVGLSPEEVTIAELLKQRNYATSAVGKWHLGFGAEHLPNNRGFNYHYGFLGAFSLSTLRI